MRETATLKRIVKARARQLKKDGKGYLESIHLIACEIYDSTQGIESPIGKYASARGIPLGDLLKTLAKLIPILTAFAKYIMGKKTTADQVRAKHKKARKKAVADISQMITPWVDEAWRS